MSPYSGASLLKMDIHWTFTIVSVAAVCGDSIGIISFNEAFLGSRCGLVEIEPCLANIEE